MSTSGTDLCKKAAKTALIYLIISAFCALFGAVYERFAHGVYSYSMIYAFAFPLLLGAVPCLLIGISGKDLKIKPYISDLYSSGIATLTVGSIACGVLEIYGTTSVLTKLYPIAGTALIAAAALLFLLSISKKK